MHRDTRTICIDRVHPDETEALLSLYIDLFYDREPLTKCLGLGRERLIEVARSMHSGANANPIARGLCWIARDRNAANEEVGFIVCDDPIAETNQQVPDNLTDQEKGSLSAVMALMEEIRKPQQERIGSEAGRCLHIAAVGVAPGYEGAGIATRLLQTALAEATERGFAHVFSECTGEASRKCHEKLGFQPLHRINLNKFAINGVCPFPTINLLIYLLWKDLTTGPAEGGKYRMGAEST